MNQQLDYPAGGTPPKLEGWTWWAPLAEADPQRQPQRPTLIEEGALREFDCIGELAGILAERLDGRAAILKRSVATFEGYDTFPAFSVYAQARGAAATAAQIYIGCAAVQKTDAASLEAAIASAAAVAKAAA